jgi:hypothetical protein
MGLGPEDEVLRSLFANDNEAQQAQQAQQQEKQASFVSRTAAVRTVGTRPAVGVNKLGGAVGVSGTAPPVHEVEKLAALWPSAPDIKDVFGMR